MDTLLKWYAEFFDSKFRQETYPHSEMECMMCCWFRIHNKVALEYLERPDGIEWDWQKEAQHRWEQTNFCKSSSDTGHKIVEIT